MPMQPRPMAETSRPWLPSLRRCSVSRSLRGRGSSIAGDSMSIRRCPGSGRRKPTFACRPCAVDRPAPARDFVSTVRWRMLLLLVLVAGLWAGLQNTLAGGGSFITLPALILSGMSPLAANITSTVALFPGQVTTGLAGPQPGLGRRHSCRSARCSSSAWPAARSARCCCWPRRRASSRAWCPGWCCSPRPCSPGAASGASRWKARRRIGPRTAARRAVPDRHLRRLFRRRHRLPDAGGADDGRAADAQRRARPRTCWPA